MEKWRKYFESSGVDAWTICERALTVAFLDNAEAFVARRDKLAQKLFAPEKMDPKACESDAPSLSCFASSLNRIPSENRAHLILKNHNGAEEEEEEEEDDRKDEDGDEVENGENSRRIVEISPDEAYDEVEALSEEMEQEVLFRRDAIRIKEMLDSHEILSEKEILESLDRLNLMELSVEILKDTEIGHTVNRLRKNTSTRVKSLAKKLVRDWKDLVNEWVKSVENVANAALEGTPASVSPDDDMVEEHGGLPSPPIDEAALLAASQTAPMEMSQLFDFMDDDDDSLFNSQGGGGGTGKPASDRRSSNLSNSILTNIKSSATSGGGGGGVKISERESKQNKEKGPPLVAGEGGSHRTKSGGNSGGIARNGCNNNVPPARPSISSNEYIKEKVKPQICGSERNVVVGGRTSLNLAKANASAYMPKDDDYHERLLVSKRKLQQNYQQAQIVKKQRTVQVMDLQDLPKGGAARAPFNRLKSSSSHFLSANKHSSQHQSWACR